MDEELDVWMMEIKEKCHNCHRPRLIERRWRGGIWCGWCGSEYKVDDMGKIYLVVGKNEHLIERDKKQCDKVYSEQRRIRMAVANG